MAPNLTYVTQEPKDVTHRSAYDEILALPDRNESIRRLFETHDVSNESYSLLSLHACAFTCCLLLLPKVGCTFWIRVFSFLNNFTGDAGRVKSPWELKRNAVHSNRHSHGQKWEAVAQEVQDYMRFVFVRHPFSRLWSAYLDKLYLPDLWRAAGVTVVAKLRNSSATAKAKRCGNDVTFREFLEYSLEVKDLHWDPIFQRCDPCTYRPTVIGNIETFERDSLFVLRRMGMEWVLKHLDQQAQVEQELSTLIVYNFDILHSRTYYQGCLDDDGLARRLWATFQMNGYIPNDANYFPPCANGTIANDVLFVDSFLKQVLDTVRKAYNRKDELKEQKRRALHDAFDAVSNTLLEKLLAKYQLDMLLFGFNEHDF
ncbi:carbohydrate sulfotransferase 11-like [Pomacea canaliculata]|uniref:carbohydrate sulfotransferase 11-like n=1 Tax=Pomacea canaliculata TaxID=400727 RepID=UPI000D72EED9|nr:carbohydrate sulfotransferase 11-like [Pomacea canaliculata]